MCGITGIISSNKKVSTEILKKMTNVIAHRGPDGDGHWINMTGEVGLGHRRLAIIDLSADGDQPMHYLGRYTIVFNGEIYNYIELKDDLIKKGYKFKSDSDTEVLLALFDQKKEKCLDDLDGMFAFAIWDEKEQRLFCARDRFGEKPFFYAVYQNSLYFASEMKALWAVGVNREKNERMLFNYLINGSLQNPNDTSETFYKGIYKLKSSHYFYVSAEENLPKQIKYWDIDYQKSSISISEEDAAEEFRRLFYESVNRRLRSDVPVGSSLSGGLDSSAVVCVIDQLRPKSYPRQSTFSARFPGFAKDEGKYMKLVINQTNVKPHFVFPDAKGLINDFEKLCRHQEEPFGSASIYAQFCVMRLAKDNGVTVLLDGQGADELLAGYLFYFDFYFKQLRNFDKVSYKTERKAYADVHANSSGFVNLSRNIFTDYVPASIQNKARKIKKNLIEKRTPFLNEDFQYTYLAENFQLNQNEPQTLSGALYKSVFETGLEDLLRYADRNSMAHSREVRLPFLSHKLAEFLFSLPDKYKINNGVTKYIMRRAFADVLPAEIIQRMDKIGYEPPQNKWLKTGEIIERINNAYRNLVDSKIIHKDFDVNKKDSPVIWRLLMSNVLSSENYFAA